MPRIAGLFGGFAVTLNRNGMVKTLREMKAQTDELAFLAPFSDKIDTLMADYDRMSGFFVKGVSDSERSQVYETLFRNTVRVARNMQMAAICTERQAFAAAYKRAAGMEISELPQALEQYAALHPRAAGGEFLNNEPQDAAVDEEGKQNDAFFNRVFSVILSSRQWTASDCEQMCEAICRPVISDDVSAMMVSAVMLSTMAVFDREKIRCLENVYDRARCEEVRQRAYVGLVLLLAQADCSEYVDDSECTELRDVCARLAADDDKSAELLSLQKQILRQFETPNLTDEVENRLMPGIIDIVKEAKPIIQKAEGDESSLEDIIDSELNERIGEKLQEKVGQLMKYKSEGMDVDYHTFRKMSPNAFFHTLSHWFVPFSIAHPELAPLRQTMGKSMFFFEMVCHNNGFCNVDAYNFLFSMYNTMSRSGLFAKSMKAMTPPADLLVMRQDVEVTPETIRIAYLRDLYRFFTLSPMKDDFFNPFAPAGMCSDYGIVAFLGCHVFAGSLFDGLRLSAGRFCAKKKWYRYICVLNLDDTYLKSDDGKLLVALYDMHRTLDYDEPIRLLTPVAMLNPHKHAVIKLLAQCCIRAEKYDDALQWYRRLPEEQTATPAVKYQMTRCLLLGAHEKEAVNGAYELDYLYPDTPRYIELLMQVLSHTGQHAKALEKARELASWHKEHGDSADVEEKVHVALSHWLAGDTAEAYRLLAACTEEDSLVMTHYLSEAEPALLRNGVSWTDYRIMRDLLKVIAK